MPPGRYTGCSAKLGLPQNIAKKSQDTPNPDFVTKQTPSKTPAHTAKNPKKLRRKNLRRGPDGGVRTRREAGRTPETGCRGGRGLNGQIQAFFSPRGF
jgi:hypothetical protein